MQPNIPTRPTPSMPSTRRGAPTYRATTAPIVWRELGAVKLFEALTLMSESKFVKNNMSINSIFKIENLKKALNGNFKDKRKVKKNEDDAKKKFERTVYENSTGSLIKGVLDGTIGRNGNGEM